MQTNGIFVSELSTSLHVFQSYHFCRGNSNKRKSRLGVILKGSGTYLYLNQKLKVSEGDVVLIPENIYCYSEWHGSPEIEVQYLSCFMHYEGFRYEPQILDCDEQEKNDILQICSRLEEENSLEAYALFYRLLQKILPKIVPSDIPFDKTLQSAVEYITNHYSEDFSIADLAKVCCVSESTLYHLFQSELGQTPVRFLNSIRINVAIEHLENSALSISTVSRLVGFHSENHFRKVFCEFVGTTPLKYRKGK